jgi:membrane-associated protein
MGVLSPEVLLVAGPGLLLLMAAAETSMPVGLLVPAGVALALGAFMASQGYLTFSSVVVAAGVGGLLGDSLGYWLGRGGFYRRLSAPGIVVRMARRYERFAARLYRRRALVAVSLARTISFVRTLMPATAGMSGMTYPRFLLFDILGVLAWLTLYTSVGVLAGESWRAASTALGTGWAAILAILGLAGWALSRFRRRRTTGPAILEPPLDGEPEKSVGSSSPT